MNVNSPEAISKEILELARNELLVNFRFLDRALLSLETKETPDASFMTDGIKLYYDPWFVNHRYKNDRNAVTRSLMHMLLHLVFRHGFTGACVDRRLWDLSCDIAVENIINDLDRGIMATKQSAGQGAVIQKLRTRIGGDVPFTAEIIYDCLEGLTCPEEEWDELSLLFWGDGHGLWYNDPDSRYSEDMDIPLRWEEISRRMQVELELLDKNKAGVLASELRHINRAHQDYDAILRKFSVEREILKISPEEFDYNYYSYGLSLYGDMPIIEPLEYSEDKRIQELVIVLDTSGSIRTGVAEKFLSHTLKILSTKQRFEKEFLLHVIQCDDRVRDDRIIRSEKDMELYIKDMKIYGRGETDFRPAFSYVDELIKKGELGALKGLIYFTDGEGFFPEDPPAYDTAFVIHRSRIYEPVKVPSWAISVELCDEDILNGKFHS